MQIQNKNIPITATNAKQNSIGLTTHHHDQVITPHNFNTINAIVRSATKPLKLIFIFILYHHGKSLKYFR